MSDEEAFALLQVRPGMAWREVARAYRRALKLAHPDQGGTREAFDAVWEAWAVVETLRLVDEDDVLGDPAEFLPWDDDEHTPTPPSTSPSSAATASTRAADRAATKHTRRWWRPAPPQVYDGPPLRRGEEPVRPRRAA